MSTPSSSSLSSRLGVVARLWLAVAVVIVALVGLISFSSLRAASIQREASAIDQVLGVKRDAALRWVGLTKLSVVRVQASAISADAAVDAGFKEATGAGLAEITQLRKEIDAMPLSDADKAQLERITGGGKSVLESYAKIRELRASGDAAATMNELQQRFNPAVVSYLASLDAFGKLQDEAIATATAALDERRAGTIKIAGTVVLGIALLLVIGARVLIRSIQQPLEQAIAVAEQIADGDLSANVTVDRGDEFGQLLTALDSMTQRLRSVVGEVRQGVESVSTASAEIATGNHDLSARTEQTASSLQQTASSMEELTGTVSNSADVARQANQLAASAAEAATRGGAVVSQVVTNMNEITASSRKIGDIIGVIDGIAFQTNILALNAAVEAARAGEQGRGFAVVASEVRSLAQRSAEAAKEIKTLIGASVARVESGAGLVTQTGTVMEEIVTSVRRVTDMIGEIASAATEQRDGISQVNVAVTQLDQMTQQNAALVEESAAAAQSLREQSARLAEVVSVFKIDASHAHKPVSAAQAAPTALRATPFKPMAHKPTAPMHRPAAPMHKPTAKKPAVTAKAAPAPARKPDAARPAATEQGDWETF